MSFNNWQFDQFNQEQSQFTQYVMPDIYSSWYGDLFTGPYRDMSPISSSSSCSNTPEIIPLVYQQPNMLPLSVEEPETSSSSMVSDISQPEVLRRYRSFNLQNDTIQEIPHSYILQTNCFYMNQKILFNKENKGDEKNDLGSGNSIGNTRKQKTKETLPTTPPTLAPPKKEAKKYTIKTSKPKTSIKEKPKPSAPKTSNEIGSYPCTFKDCDKQFLRPYNLKSHMRTHTSERPYSCLYPDCEWRFARPHDLKRHQLQHTGLKPHSCKSCNRRFARSDALKRHLKVDTTCAQTLRKDE